MRLATSHQPKKRKDTFHMLSESSKQRIIDRIASTGVEKASEYFGECLKFLALCAARPGQAFVPSLKVDEAWHEFILCTREYTEHCSEFGRYVHHDPTDGPDLVAYEATRNALIQEHGEINEEIWPPLSAGTCSGSCEGGSCKTIMVAGSCTGSCSSGKCKTFF
jgi:hypothetical protein